MNNKTVNSIQKLSLLSVLTFSLISLQGCEDATASIDKEEAAKEIVKVPVEVYRVYRSDIANYYAANATLESTNEADVISKVQGLIQEIYVEEGDFVKKGQLLAKVDDTRYQLILQQRQADLAQVQSELSRLNAAQNKSIVSADKLEKLQWQFESLQASTNIAKLDVTETNIVAPISGFVANRYVKTGNLVHQYQHKNLFNIVAQNQLEGVIFLPEGRFPEVKVNQPVELSLPAIGNKTFQAKIARVSPVVDSNNGTFKVVVQVDNTNGELKPGMFAEVNIELGLHQNALLAPSSAVISLDDKQYVYEVVDGKAVKTDIEVGYTTNGIVEVVAGLDEEASLITAGHNNLKDNSEVTIIQTQD